MPKDLKIGMILGVVLVTAVGVWLCSRQELSVETRREQKYSGSVVTEYPVEPSRFQMPLPDNSSSSKTTTSPTKETSVTKPKKLNTTVMSPIVHVVRQGETLSSIAQQYYGSTKRIDDIRAANRNVIKKSDVILPGMRLTIPD